MCGSGGSASGGDSSGGQQQQQLATAVAVALAGAVGVGAVRAGAGEEVGRSKTRPHQQQPGKDHQQRRAPSKPGSEHPQCSQRHTRSPVWQAHKIIFRLEPGAWTAQDFEETPSKA